MGFRGKLAIDVVALIAYLAATNTKLTGIPIHEWLSTALALVIALHIALDWEYSIKVLRHFVRKLLSLSRFNLLVDLVLLALFAAVMLSGFLVSQVVVPLLGMSVPFGPTWRILHSLTATFALPVLGVHVGLHWRWIVKATSRAFTPRASARPDSATSTAEV